MLLNLKNDSERGFVYPKMIKFFDWPEIINIYTSFIYEKV